MGERNPLEMKHLQRQAVWVLRLFLIGSLSHTFNVKKEHVFQRKTDFTRRQSGCTAKWGMARCGPCSSQCKGCQLRPAASTFFRACLKATWTPVPGLAKRGVGGGVSREITGCFSIVFFGYNWIHLANNGKVNGVNLSLFNSWRCYFHLFP